MLTGNNEKMRAGANTVVGIMGGFIGGLVMNLLGGSEITGFNRCERDKTKSLTKGRN